MTGLLSIAIEAKTKCRKCDDTLHLNALTDEIVCQSCGEKTCFSVSDWKSIIGDAINEVPGFKEGEGNNASIFGSYNFQIMYGKQKPKFPDDKKPLNLERLSEFADKGFAVNPDTGKKYSVRIAPDKYKKAFPGILYLVFEDFGLITSGKKAEDETLINAPEPVAFACPKCGGFLDVDGKERMIKCSFCKASVYLPDDLWKRIHPVETISRWYIIFDEKAKPFGWEGEIWDSVVDGKGDIYIASENEDSNLTLAALNKDLLTKWIVSDLQYTPDSSEGNPKLAIDSKNRLMLWSREKHALIFISTQTGDVVDRIGGNKGRQPSEKKDFFSMKNTWTLCADTDDTFLAVINREKQDSENNDYYELKRFDYDGNAVKTWKEDKETPEKENRSIIAGYLEELEDKPVYFRDREIVLSVGYDGNYYILNYEKLMKYSREGKKIYLIKLDFRYTYSRPYADKEGNAYVLGSDQNDVYSVIKVSPDGKQMKHHFMSVTKNGVIGSEEVMAMSEDGNFILLGYDGKMRIISSEGKLLYRSENSEKDDNKKRKEKRED